MEKVLLIAFALLLAHPVEAATDDAADPSSANLVNLDYYLHPGLFRIEPSTVSAINEFYGVTDASFTEYELFVEYGLPIDGLRVSVADSQRVTGYTDSNTGMYYYSGLTDPTLQVNYRIIDATPSGWSVDARISVTPGIGTSYAASFSDPGTNAAGGTTAGVGAGAYWRLGANEAELSGSITHWFSGSFTRQDQSVFTSDARWLGDIELADRLHLCPRFYIQGLAEFQFAHSLTRNYSSSDIEVTGTPFNVQPVLQFGFLATKQVLLEAHVRYEGYDQTENGDNVELRETTWGMSASIEF